MAYSPPNDPTNVMGRRIAAYIIDGVISGVITAALLAATKSQSLTDAPTRACATLRGTTDFNGTCVQLGSHVYTWTGGRFALGLLAGVLIGAANLVLLQGLTGASLGKMIIGLRTVDAQGNPCGVGRAVVRWLLLIVDSFFCGFVGLITALVTHPHRRIGDMVANTYVVAAADAGRPIPGLLAPPMYAYPGTGAAPWGAPGTQPPAPDWGAQPQPPAWGAPAAAWGTQPTATAPPAPETPSWGAPAPTSAPPPPPPPPPPPDQPPSIWTPPPPADAPSYQAPPPPPPPPPATPPPAPTPPPAATPPPTYDAPPATDAPSAGEAWWDKAVGDEEEPKQ